MSELESHLTSYKTSQRLLKAGAEFETLFCWAVDDDNEEAALIPKAVAAAQSDRWTVICPAYLASELSAIIGQAGAWMSHPKGTRNLYVRATLRNGTIVADDTATVEAEGRGLVFATLLEKKLIEPMRLLERL